MLNRLSLSKSLPLLLGIFAAAYILMMVLLHLPLASQRVETDLKRYTEQVLILAQSSVSEHLRHQRHDELQNVLADLGSLPGVRWAMVVDSQQNVLSATRLGLSLSDTLPDSGLLDSLFDHQRSQWHPLQEHRYLASYPLVHRYVEGKPLSNNLLVMLDYEENKRQRSWSTWLALASTLGLLLIMGFLLNILYGRLVTRRLSVIGTAVKQYSDGDTHAQAKVGGRDEISQLARDFNRMIHQLGENQAALRNSEQLLRNLVSAAPIAMLITDANGRIQEANPAASRLFNTPLSILNGMQSAALLGLANWTILREQPRLQHEISVSNGNQLLFAEASCTPFERYGQAFQLLLLNDIGDRKRAEQRLRYLANFDQLTEVANRNHLLIRLDELISRGGPLSLLFLNIDHFKRINDSLGHDVGDQLLHAVADRLRPYAKPRDLLARLGGDEFLFLLDGSDSIAAIARGEQLVEALRQPFLIRQYSLYITASLGMTHYCGRGGSGNELLKQADLALLRAKAEGRNRLACFDSHLAAEAEERQRLEHELRAAIAREEFELHYQPQVDNDNRPRSVEALLRWHSPSRGLVSPAVFIPVLEDTGMIRDVSRWVFRQACRQAVLWLNQGLELRVAVNLSPLDFRQPDLAERLTDILAEENTPARLIELEITESALLESDTYVQDTLGRLKEAGLPLYLDDFGTGYSSLTYLQKFRFDGVKIDRQFVAELPENPRSVALVRGILTMAAQMGLEVVAEGVENERQAAFLRLNGCKRLQGFLYARPRPAADCDWQAQRA